MESIKLNDEIRSQKFHVIWHDGKFRTFSGDYDTAKIQYDFLSPKFAKCLVTKTGVILSHGGDYRQMTIGYAISLGLIDLKSPKKFVVIWHHKENLFFLSDDEEEALKQYNLINENYAKCFVKNGRIEKSYGGDYKYFCMFGILDLFI